MITNHTYKLNNIAFTKEIASTHINIFWHDTYNNIIAQNPNRHLMLLVKVHFANKSTGYRTLGPLRSVSHLDKELFINYITQRLGVLNDSYNVSEVSKIIFSYIIKEGLAIAAA
jgi:hypothetical protein